MFLLILLKDLVWSRIFFLILSSTTITPSKMQQIARATNPNELDDKIIEMLNTDRPVIFDCLVDKQENCFPMIPSGKPHNQMLLGPKDQEQNKITGKGKTLV